MSSSSRWLRWSRSLKTTSWVIKRRWCAHLKTRLRKRSVKKSWTWSRRCGREISTLQNTEQAIQGNAPCLRSTEICLPIICGRTAAYEMLIISHLMTRRQSHTGAMTMMTRSYIWGLSWPKARSLAWICYRHPCLPILVYRCQMRPVVSILIVLHLRG